MYVQNSYDTFLTLPVPAKQHVRHFCNAMCGLRTSYSCASFSYLGANALHGRQNVNPTWSTTNLQQRGEGVSEWNTHHELWKLWKRPEIRTVGYEPHMWRTICEKSNMGLTNSKLIYTRQFLPLDKPTNPNAHTRLPELTKSQPHKLEHTNPRSHEFEPTYSNPHTYIIYNPQTRTHKPMNPRSTDPRVRTHKPVSSSSFTLRHNLLLVRGVGRSYEIVELNQHGVPVFPERCQMFTEWCKKFPEWFQMFPEWCQICFFSAGQFFLVVVGAVV